MTATPTLNGQAIGQAEKATRAVFDRLLSDNGTTFHQWVVVNLVADAGGEAAQDQVATRMAFGLKVDEATALAAIDEVRALGLVATVGGAPDRIELTASGAERFRRIRGGIDRITERLYRDLAADDLAIAGRMLAVVTERANVELAAGASHA